MRAPKPRSALEQLREAAEQAQQTVHELLHASELRPAAVSSGQYFEWHVKDSGSKSLRSRAMQLYQSFRDDLTWILFHHDPLSEDGLQYFADDVFRIIDQRGHTQIASIGDAEARVVKYFEEGVDSVSEIFDPLEDQIVIIPDTNVLISFPDLSHYHFGLTAVRVVFSPIVLKELDNHKRRIGEEIGQKARRVISQLKDCGDRGDIIEGVPISDRVKLMTMASEPRQEGLLDWLDLGVPDDRFVASALEVKRAHPKGKLLVVSEDFNVLNKARAARLSAFDPEEFLKTITPGSPTGEGKTRR